MWCAQHGPHSCGCKSRRKLTTASEVKRNCEPMNKNRIEGAVEQNLKTIRIEFVPFLKADGVFRHNQLMSTKPKTYTVLT